MEETVTISKKEYEELLEDQLLLQCLQGAGVEITGKDMIMR